VAMDVSFSSFRRIVVPASAGSIIPSQFFFFDCLTLKLNALRHYETSRTTRSTHLEYSATCQENLHLQNYVPLIEINFLNVYSKFIYLLRQGLLSGPMRLCEGD